ncbi:MAG: hypothetical protein AB7E85_05130 [Pseudobdellovibrionaceae bacterium]
MLQSSSSGSQTARQSFKAVLASWAALSLVTATCVFFSLPEASALSFQDMSQPHVESVSSQVKPDPCQSLLQADDTDITPLRPVNVSADQADLIRRKAGQAAIVSVLLGIGQSVGVNATGPAIANQMSQDDGVQATGTESHHSQVLAVSAWRACQKEKALETLKSARADL